MLHIHNGDASAGVGMRSDLEGSHLAFRECLSEGPAPDVSVDEWRAIRARFLADEYRVSEAQCLDDFARQDEALARAPEHDEVIVWVEHDLLCQVTLCAMLSRLADSETAPKRLSFVSADEFPGIPGFRGLGELSPDQMVSLFPFRKPADGAALRSATAFWAAYRSPAPRALEVLASADTSALPHLAPALRRHLDRFPSTRDGLGRVERSLLEILDGGPLDFRTLFARFFAREPGYGLGDLQVSSELERLAACERPLVRAAERVPRPGGVWAIAEAGRDVLAGRARFDGGGHDRWIGGVLLPGGRPDWARDASSGSLVHAPQ